MYKQTGKKKIAVLVLLMIKGNDSSFVPLTASPFISVFSIMVNLILLH